MEYIINDYKGDNKKNFSKYGLKVFDKEGNEYHIGLNQFGELEITGNDGNLIVHPRYANQVLIKTQN